MIDSKFSKSHVLIFLLASCLVHGLVFVCVKILATDSVWPEKQPVVFVRLVDVKAVANEVSNSIGKANWPRHISKQRITKPQNPSKRSDPGLVTGNNTFTDAQESAGQVIGPLAIQGANQKPRYPRASRLAQEEGLVTLVVHIDEFGNVREAHVEDSSGYLALDQSALVAVKEWKYEPARRGEMRVSSVIKEEIRFQLN